MWEAGFQNVDSHCINFPKTNLTTVHLPYTMHHVFNVAAVSIEIAHCTCLFQLFGNVKTKKITSGYLSFIRMRYCSQEHILIKPFFTNKPYHHESRLV